MKKLNIKFYFLLSTIIMASIAGNSQNPDSLKFLIQSPLVDYPFNFKNGYFVPGMKQALMTTKSFYETSLYGIDKVVSPINKKNYKILAKAAISVVYFSFATYLPFGDAWLHEEYHRSVLKNYNINSYNDVYNFNFFSNTIAVSHVKDQDLVMLKKSSNPDFVRLNSAGMEAQNELTLSLQKDHFYYNMQSELPVIYWLELINNWFYIHYCTTEDANSETDNFNRNEKTIEVRDFTGFDFTAWTYDLFHSSEAYEMRGIHPSNLGLDRYIKNSDLTTEEQNYLIKQSRLNLLSFIDPTLIIPIDFVIKHYADGKVLKFNANLKHYLTSFGHTVNLNLFFKKSDLKVFISILNQKNYKHYFPGIDIQLVNYPILLGSKRIFCSPRLLGWLQPKSQDFLTSSPHSGVLGGIEVSYPVSKYFALDFQVEGKTKGWVASNVNLDNALDARFGISLYFK